MHGISNKTNPFDIIAANAEKQNNTIVAICAKSWHLPIYKQTIEYSLSTIRKATVIEEYIMKAANMDLSYPVNISLLPELLGLDEIFLEDAIKNLIEKKILDKTAIPALKLTENGKNHLNNGTVFDKERIESIEYYLDRKFLAVYASPKEVPEIGMHPRYEFLDKNIENAKKYINHKFLTEAGKAIGREIENPKMGTKISSVISAKTTDAVKTLFTEITCLDMAENKLIRKIWDHAGKRFRDDLSKIFDSFNIDSGYRAELKKCVGLFADIQALFTKKEPGIKICRGKEKLDLVGLKNTGTEVIHNDACNVKEIITDNTIIISGIKWAECSGDFVDCSDADYVISDEEFVSKRKMMIND